MAVNPHMHALKKISLKADLFLESSAIPWKWVYWQTVRLHQRPHASLYQNAVQAF